MSLKRDLGLLHATMMGLGSTICAGVFVVLSRAFELAGPAVVLAFLCAGVINIATMFSYCELGSAMPSVGGEYVYAKEAFNGPLGFLTGWYEWSSNLLYATLMVKASTEIVSQLVPVHRLALMGILLSVFTVINVRGIKQSGVVETGLTLALLAVLLVFIGAGLIHSFQPDAFQPLMPRGPSSVFVAVAFIFETYVGVEAIAASQAEIRTPEKTIPRAMILCSIALVAIYCLVAYVTVGILSPDVLAASLTPLNLVAEKTMGFYGVLSISVAGLIAGLTSLNSAIIASSRAACALGQDGFLPKAFANVHDGCRTPHIATIIGSILVFLLSVSIEIELVVYLISFGFLVGFSLVNLSLIRLRKNQPNLSRPFKTPLYPLTPIIGLGTSVALLAFFEAASLLSGILVGVVGLSIYALKRYAFPCVT